jgi:hypothetical protein
MTAVSSRGLIPCSVIWAWVLSLTALLVPTNPLCGQKATRFDFGTTTSPLASGFTRATHQTRYVKSLGYGWTLLPSNAALRPMPVANVQHALPTDLIRDLVFSYRDCTFQVDLPSGQYLCVAYLGDLGDPTTKPRPQRTPREFLDIKVNGTEVVTDAFARTATRKAQLTTEAIGGYKRVRFLATPKSGSIQLTFHCNGRHPSVVSLMGLEIYPYQPPPIRFDHTTSKLQATGSWQTTLGPALTAFNQHDYAKAKTLLDGLGDSLGKAWGYAWYLGWPKGHEADMDLALLAKTRTLLEKLNLPDDPNAAVLLQDVKDMQKGLRFNFLRGYSSSIFADSLDNIVYNLAAAVQLFEQMQGDILSATPNATLPECPFFPKARFLLARNMYSRYTGVGDPKQPWAAMWLGILTKEFMPRLSLFPKAINVEFFTFFANRYAYQGGMQNWRGPRYVPTYDPKTAWWAKYTQFVNHASAPKWANSMRAYYNSLRNAGDWWMQKRLFDGELGGGGGDDVEGGALLTLSTICLTEPGNRLEEGGRSALEKVLFGPEVDQDQGYFWKCGDVEHAGEFTSNPLFVLLPTNYGEPAHITLATRTIRNMDEKVDKFPWTTLVGPGERHFRTYTHGANAVCGAARDIPCNIRAIIPGFFLMDYNNSPRIKQLFDELARAWSKNSVSTAQSKPKGIPPTSVSPTANPVFGTGGSWWKNGGYYDLPNGSQYYGYLYALFITAYHNSTATDRQVFLEPILHSGYLVEDLIKGRLTGTAAGQPKWTAETLKTVVANAVAEAYPALARDPNLKLTSANLQRLSTVINTYAAPYMQYLHQSSATTKSKKTLEETLEGARVWMSYFWPIGTSAVAYTDRIGVMWHNSHQLIYSAMLGGPFSVNPSYVASWVNPNPAQGKLDIAALVHHFDVDALDALIFNYETKKRDIALRLWRRLEFGRYTVSIGNDANHDDKMDGVPHTKFTLTYDARGKTVILPQVRSGTLQKVELRKISSLPGSGAMLPDLAVGTRDIRLLPGARVDVTVHNLGSANTTGGTLELLTGIRVVAAQPIPVLSAPNDLTPRSVVISFPFPYEPKAANAPLTARIRPPAGMTEVTTLNNEVTVELPTQPTLHITNQTSTLSFDVEIRSAFDPSMHYFIGAGWSGTTPGTLLAPGVTLPLNWDWLTQFALFQSGGVFNNPFGTLNSAGAGSMQVRIPQLPGLRGLKLYFAGVIFTPGTGPQILGVSKPVSTRL